MDREYIQEIISWREKADQSIRRENSWLALEGLFWLEQGDNPVGSNPESRVRLPDPAPARVGEIVLVGNTATFRSANSEIRANGEFLTETVLQPDTRGEPTRVTLGELTFILIERHGRFGIRLWDNGRVQRRSYPTRIWYPIDETYRVSGSFEPYPGPKATQLPDVSGELREGTMDGAVSFELHGQILQLEASKEDEHELFIMFADATSGRQTYPPGRYMVANLDDHGNVTLDFNKAYNPPCAFTQFATCLFAPGQNLLSVPVKAGERYSGGH